MNSHFITIARWLVAAMTIALTVQIHAQTPASAPTSAASSSATSAPARATKKPATAVASSASSSAPAAKTSNDRLELDTTTVSGNRDLPKVQYIVPWKKADVGNLPGQPFNTLLDEALTPVDREVFRREVEYYQAVSNKDQPGKGYAGAGKTVQPAPQSDGK